MVFLLDKKEKERMLKKEKRKKVHKGELKGENKIYKGNIIDYGGIANNRKNK